MQVSNGISREQLLGDSHCALVPLTNGTQCAITVNAQ